MSKGGNVFKFVANLPEFEKERPAREFDFMGEFFVDDFGWG